MHLNGWLLLVLVLAVLVGEGVTLTVMRNVTKAISTVGITTGIFIVCFTLFVVSSTVIHKFGVGVFLSIVAALGLGCLIAAGIGSRSS